LFDFDVVFAQKESPKEEERGIIGGWKKCGAAVFVLFLCLSPSLFFLLSLSLSLNAGQRKKKIKPSQ
jgi:ABC-type nickel/cobalt efflux system permease component RcnA